MNNKTTLIKYNNGDFVWGYNDVPYSRRESINDVYFTKHRPLNRITLSWREECITTAKLIYT